MPKLAPVLDVLRACLQPDPTARPTAALLRQHPFFQQASAAQAAAMDTVAAVMCGAVDTPAGLSDDSSGQTSPLPPVRFWRCDCS
jgi:hypothetical protein